MYEVQSFRLKEDITQDITLSVEKLESRLHMKKCEKYRKTENARYAVKHIKKKYVKTCKKENKFHAYAQAAG